MEKPSLRASLPPIYADLLSTVFDAPKVDESRATCDACQMCDHGGPKNEAQTEYFHPDTKCCTFFPSLANYLVGAILADERPEIADGKRRIRERIASRVGVLPQRVAPSKKWSVLYAAAMESSFGRSALLRCPYLSSEGRCTIWRHREAVCFTFFCKYDHGAFGSELWNELKAYLSTVERILSVWAAKQIWPEVKDLRHSSASTLTLEELEERPPSEEAYAAAWGAWVGREEEFYVACHDRVKAMGRAELAKLVDDTTVGRERLAKLASAIDNLRVAKVVPTRAALSKHLRVLPASDGVVLTMPYNTHDSIKIEGELYDVLRAFTHDRTVAEVRASLEAEQGIELEDELLSMFAMHQILVGPPKGGICEVSPPPSLVGARCAAPPKK